MLKVAQSEPRQRWRVAYRRSADAPRLTPGEQVAAWERALVATCLPLIGLDLVPARPRIVFAAPLGIGVSAELEFADFFLSERRPVADVRRVVSDNIPDGHALLDLHDVWLGAPALPGQVVAADYRGRVAVDAGLSTSLHYLTDAARRVLMTTSLPRTREKGGRLIPYDLRPLLGTIEIRADQDPSAHHATIELRIRVLYDVERGVGRPEEVLGALSESAGVSLSFVSLVRERVVLATDT